MSLLLDFDFESKTSPK